MSNNSSSLGLQAASRANIAQAVVAVVISSLAYLGLIYFEQHYGQGLRYSRTFFGRWTELLCLLLTAWSLLLLFARWRKSANRAAAIRNSSFPSALPPGDESFNGVIASLTETGRKYGDDSVVERVRRLVDEYRVSHDSASVANVLNSESDAAQIEVESSFTPIRIFAWTIPLLGLIGTVLGIGQALGDFAVFLATGSQKQEAIRAALYQATFNLGFAFEATLVAVLLTCVVAVAYLLLLHQEKSLLRDVDSLCRTGLLPLMRRESSAVAGGAYALPNLTGVTGTSDSSAETSAIRATLVELRDNIGAVSPALRQLAGHLRETAGEAGTETKRSFAAGA
jgi:biopolymer transport protein ExbB/TolQ